MLGIYNFYRLNVAILIMLSMVYQDTCTVHVEFIQGVLTSEYLVVLELQHPRVGSS